MAQETPPINLAEYAEKKAIGTVKVVLLHGRPHYTQRKFNPDHGGAEPVLFPLDRDGLAKAIIDMKQNIVNAEMLLKDIDDAKEVL